MSVSVYTTAQKALAELKGSIHSVLSESESGVTNAELGRALGIYTGHKGHEGHISRTLLGIIESEGVVVQDEKTKIWTLR